LKFISFKGRITDVCLAIKWHSCALLHQSSHVGCLARGEDVSQCNETCKNIVKNEQQQIWEGTVSRGSIFHILLNCSIPVEDIKTDHSIIIYKTTTHLTELDLSYLHTFAHSDKAQYFQERYQLIHNALSSI
jgi:hypothetical protein